MHWCTHSSTSAPIHAGTYLSSLPLRGLPSTTHLLTHSPICQSECILIQLRYYIPCSLTPNAHENAWTVEQGNLPRLILLQSNNKQAFIPKPTMPPCWQAFPCLHPFTSVLTQPKALSVAIGSAVDHLSDDSGHGEGGIQNRDCTTTPLLAAPFCKQA